MNKNKLSIPHPFRFRQEDYEQAGVIAQEASEGAGSRITRAEIIRRAVSVGLPLVLREAQTGTTVDTTFVVTGDFTPIISHVLAEALKQAAKNVQESMPAAQQF